MRKQLFSFLFASLFSVLAYGQITIDESLTVQELVEDILIDSPCAEVSNIVSSTGVDFGDVNGISFFSSNGSDFPFEEGILLMSGDVQEAIGPNLDVQSNGSNSWPGDADLEANTTAEETLNASFIEFNFTPFIEQISFDFIMASEEYNRQFECEFSDAFAFILTDLTTGDVQNLAVLPGTNIPVTVTNIHTELSFDDGAAMMCDADNEEFFDRYNFSPFNDENASATDFNGQTVELTAMADVTVGNPYTIKLVVADSFDTDFDIGVFLEAGSFNIGATDLGDDILISNGNAVCEGEAITLNAEDPDAISYTWFMDGVEITGETDPTLDVTTPGVYSVVVILNSTDCVIEDEVVVEFISGASVSLGANIEVCEGNPVTLDVGLPDGVASYSWLFNSVVISGETGTTLDVTESGEYTVIAAFNSGCTFSSTVEVNFQTMHIIELGGDFNTCFEEEVVLDATPTNVDPAGSTYEWSLDGTVIAGEVDPMLIITEEGTYDVTVTFGICSNTDTITVTRASPDGSPCPVVECPVLDLGQDQIICEDGSSSFTIIPTITGDTTGITYAWSTGETTNSITVNTSGTISLTITTTGGCVVTDDIDITLATPINVSLGNDFTTCREFPNTLTAVSDDPNVTYEWFLGDELVVGETSETLDFVVPQTALSSQVYTVVITSSLGCTSSDTIEVSLFDIGNCIITQGISPDDSPGFNDTLDLEFLAARSGIDVLQIYNRHGRLVYEQSDYTNQWRGQTDNDNDLPTGTYFYVINLETEDSVYGTQATGWIYINRGE